MFTSFFEGALCALLAAFLIAAIAKWADLQPNRVAALRRADRSHITATVVSDPLRYDGGTLYGGVPKFLADATDLMRPGAQRSSV
jgi:hypothetical protein